MIPYLRVCHTGMGRPIHSDKCLIRFDKEWTKRYHHFEKSSLLFRVSNGPCLAEGNEHHQRGRRSMDFLIIIIISPVVLAGLIFLLGDPIDGRDG
jgi:hypothetical protein